MDLTSLSSIADTATILAAVVGIVALVAVLYQLRHIRTTNFISAWNAIEQSLQSDPVRVGRGVCHTLTDSRPDTKPRVSYPEPDGWGPTLTYLGSYHGNDKWYQDLLAQSPSVPAALELERYIARAYDAFDLVAILAWYGRVPGLWYAVVAEWEDGIIRVWRAGAPRLLWRADSSRRELFECFSALYSAALQHRRRGRRWYPWGAWFRTFGVAWPRWLIAKRAFQYRTEILALGGPPPASSVAAQALPPGVAGLADLNHELYQLMRLHPEMRRWRWRLYPRTVKRAADVAYAAHLRVLLEFFKNGRSGADVARVGCPKRNDLTVSQLDPTWTSTSWTDDELRRLCDADKLLSHLSKDRRTRQSDWGRDADWAMLRTHIDRLLKVITSGLEEARQARRQLP